MKLLYLHFFLAIIFAAVSVNCASAREITHEDIKDAMLSLVHMMRENTEKLERHEARERQLGEQLKKSIALLTKRAFTVDALKSHLTKLDERIAGIEQLISQRDERERIQIQRTTDTLEDLGNRLEARIGDIDAKIQEEYKKNVPKERNIDTDIDTELRKVLERFNDSQSQLVGTVDSYMRDITKKISNEGAIQREETSALASEIKLFSSKMEGMESSLETFKENSKIDSEKPDSNLVEYVTPAFEEQNKSLTKLQELLEDTSAHIRQLPRLSEVQAFHNESQMSLREARDALKDTVARGLEKVENQMVKSKEDAKVEVDALRMDLANNAERVNQELKDLGKGQSVMVSMADHVLDTKKRVEYGVHQILLEVGDLVKAQGSYINDTLNLRFDGISNDIMDNQNGALNNLTSKMEQEMTQVWRQINIMYQQMTESARALERLHKQNEAYVNGTTSTMGGMETKVGEITRRMTEVDENLNYLLGRLSLVTQEFNRIKTGLGTALDNIKASFKEVQEKANNLSHPGPHPLPQNYDEDEPPLVTGKPSSSSSSSSSPPPPPPPPQIVNHLYNPRTN